MRIIGRVLHALLVLILTFLLIWSVHYAFSLLLPQQRPPQRQSKEVEEYERVPTVQDIAKSLNTHWYSFDIENCRNVCEASYEACRGRLCDGMVGVKRWNR
ncbi:hypothetical protein K505DRAFT_417249 [Melanomma pulvis-pyrius CBS 109.77]|uniref:Uncharacterized protein n=1 Tax=Melanomma pulvis-pyrius CBS 109.77 TaxID=1314802 RepID=A0A6A6XCU1_9PLEO|nr:hypothetical protein K505DRAFT_417249 [Melanomma pulvis-pyrius CBS 109.77]